MGGFGKDPVPGFSDNLSSIIPATPSADTLQLRILNGPCQGRTFALSGFRIRIGRSDPPAVRVDIDLSECELGSPAMISRLHAEFLWVDGKLNIVDLGSRNGTWVKDQPVLMAEQGPASLPIPLEAGARIRLANLEMEIVRMEVTDKV